MKRGARTAVSVVVAVGIGVLGTGVAPGPLGPGEAEALFLPKIKRPKLPKIKLPKIKLPKIKLPKIKLPKIKKEHLLLLLGAGKLGAAGKALGKMAGRIGKGLKGLGKRFGKGLKGVGKKLRELLGKKGPRGIGGRIRAQVQRVLHPLAQRLARAAMPVLRGLVQMALNTVAAKVAPSFEQLVQTVQGGRVNEAKLKQLFVERVSSLIRPFLEEKVALAIGKVLSAVRPGLDAAVQAAVGALGSIPFAGGVIASAVVAAYGWGVDQLPKLGSSVLVSQAEATVIRPLLGSGFVLRLPPVRAVYLRLLASARKLAELMRRASRCKGAS